MKLSDLKCAICGNPATCVGHYESGDEEYDPACDDCCGHGNEDGHCVRCTEDEPCDGCDGRADHKAGCEALALMGLSEAMATA